MDFVGCSRSRSHALVLFSFPQFTHNSLCGLTRIHPSWMKIQAIHLGAHTIDTCKHTVSYTGSSSGAKIWKFRLYVPDARSFPSLDRSTDITFPPSVGSVRSSCQSSALQSLTKPS